MAVSIIISSSLIREHLAENSGFDLSWQNDLARMLAHGDNPIGRHLIVVMDLWGGEFKGDRGEVYAEVYGQWWDRVDGKIVEGSGRVFPARFRFVRGEEKYGLVGYDAPADGSLFVVGVKAIFPRAGADMILKRKGLSAELRAENRRLAESLIIRNEQK